MTWHTCWCGTTGAATTSPAIPSSAHAWGSHPRCKLLSILIEVSYKMIQDDTRCSDFHDFFAWTLHSPIRTCKSVRVTPTPSYTPAPHRQLLSQRSLGGQRYCACPSGVWSGFDRSCPRRSLARYLGLPCPGGVWGCLLARMGGGTASTLCGTSG